MSRQTFSISELLMLFLGICILCVSSFMAGFSISQETPTTSERELSNYYGLLERNNMSVTGVYFPSATYCVLLSRDNIDALYQTADHELLHHLVKTNRSHFCGSEE